MSAKADVIKALGGTVCSQCGNLVKKTITPLDREMRSLPPICFDCDEKNEGTLLALANGVSCLVDLGSDK